MRDCQLFLRDLFRRVAEHLGVLERDVRELDDLRADDVRRVQPSTETRLDHGHVHIRFRELEHGRGRQHLELRRAQLDRRLTNPRDGPLEGRRITIQPLVPAGDVRGGVRARAQAFGAEELGDRTGRSRLPVRPDDVDRRVATLRIAEPGE